MSKNRAVKVLLALVILASAFGLGYYAANRQKLDEVNILSGQLLNANNKAKYLYDRVYLSERNDFLIVFPEHWVGNVSVIPQSNSEIIALEQAEKSFQTAITVYRCQIGEESKCPGESVRRTDTNIYTWQATNRNVNFESGIGNTEKVVNDWKNLVLPTFQVVN